MTHTTLKDILSQQEFSHPIWQKVFNWLEHLPNDLPLGEHNIQNREIYANRFDADTMPAIKAPYEVHQKYIDVHFCIAGGEIIRYGTINAMQITTPHDAKKDYALYSSKDPQQEIRMQPGMLAIFMPNEAHAPKISDGKNTSVKKIVVKIGASLLG